MRQHNKLSQNSRQSKKIGDTDSADTPFIQKPQQRLRLLWWSWLGYRSVLLPVLLGVFLSTQPPIFGGMFWQTMWLIPALAITYWIHQAKSPYALLTSSMLTLIYFGASGVVLFMRFYDSGLHVIWVYAIDTLLLLMVNLYLFVLLKKLPSMNG